MFVVVVHCLLLVLFVVVVVGCCCCFCEQASQQCALFGVLARVRPLRPGVLAREKLDYIRISINLKGCFWNYCVLFIAFLLFFVVLTLKQFLG